MRGGVRTENVPGEPASVPCDPAGLGGGGRGPRCGCCEQGRGYPSADGPSAGSQRDPELKYCIADVPTTDGGRTTESAQRLDHHSISCRSLKNRPLGPFAGSVSAHTMVSAPCSTERGAPDPPMRVRTQPGFTQLTSTPVPLVAAAS